MNPRFLERDHGLPVTGRGHIHPTDRLCDSGPERGRPSYDTFADEQVEKRLQTRSGLEFDSNPIVKVRTEVEMQVLEERLNGVTDLGSHSPILRRAHPKLPPGSFCWSCPCAMPVLSAQVQGAILAQLSMTGSDLSKLMLGIGIGVQQWVLATIVQTQDVGTAGAGTGGPFPVLAPALTGNVISGVTSVFSGTDAASLAAGIGGGIQTALQSGLIQTTHAGVGTGTGIVRFQAPSAVGFIQAGLAAAGITGTYAGTLAAGVGQGLDRTWQTFITSIPIVGSVSPSGASGVGIGKIV